MGGGLHAEHLVGESLTDAFDALDLDDRLSESLQVPGSATISVTSVPRRTGAGGTT